MQPVTSAAPSALGNRITYERSSLGEWYVNDERGLEQGFTLYAPPPALATNNHDLLLQLEMAGSLRPKLIDSGQTLAMSDMNGRELVHYSKLQAFDAHGKMLPSHFELENTSETSPTRFTMRIVVDDGTAVYPVTIDLLATTPGWMDEGDQAGAELGFPVRSAGDINGDGYDDVIIGARFYDNGQTDEGRAYVYYGSASGLGTVADWVAEGNQSGAHFGRAVDTAGDVNNDGYDDIIVAALGYDNGQVDEGMIFVFHGSASGLNCGVGCPVDAVSASDWSAESNHSNSAIGGSGGLAPAGNVNGDGYDDILFGANQFDHPEVNEGLALLFYGSSTGISCAGGCPVDAVSEAGWIAELDVPSALLGRSTSSGRDVNGDGYLDVIIGASGYANGQSSEGAAFVYYGETFTPSPTPTATDTPQATLTPTATTIPTGVEVVEFSGQSNSGYFILVAQLFLLALLVAIFFFRRKPESDGS